MKIALAQINTSMGSIETNVKKIAEYLDKAHAMGADLTVFPELSIVGYPPKDLVEQKGFVESNQNALERLCKDHADKRFIVGFIEANPSRGKGRFNAAAYVEFGKIRNIQRKSLLPTYDVFDENRYFDRAKNQSIVEVMGIKVGITICEDMWAEEKVDGKIIYDDRPIDALKLSGVDLFINISGSPYHVGKQDVRKRIISSIVSKYKVPFVFVNLVGGNDELIFDGGSFAMDAAGSVAVQARVFQEDLVLFDVDGPNKHTATWPSKEEDWMTAALSLGLRDYAKKCGFKKAVLGLSGGIDSALSVLLAVEALGKENVSAILMPSPYNIAASTLDSEEICKILGIEKHIVPIQDIMSSYDRSLEKIFSGQSKDVTEENIQARIRGNILMAYSNKFGHLVLSTGNKSELAVGYCTQYGDMAGGLAVISDLYKHEVYALTRHLNQKYKAIPENIFARPPSAELRENQTDQDSLPPYDQLDAILEHYIEEKLDVNAIVREGFDQALVERVVGMVDRNEFKRKQAAPGLRVSPKAFGLGRRMPIARGTA